RDRNVTGVQTCALPILILDEPTSGLDPAMRDELVDIVLDFMENEDHTVLFSTHITQDLDRIADYIVFIDEGKIVFEGTKDEFYEIGRASCREGMGIVGG